MEHGFDSRSRYKKIHFPHRNDTAQGVWRMYFFIYDIMEIFLIILATILAIAGLLGSVLPVLPGPPLSFVGLWLMWLLDKDVVSNQGLWIMGIIMVLVTIIDFIASVWLTKTGGGSKETTKWATVGLLLGLFFLPWGLVIGPFIGAFIGELLQSSKASQALKVASLSFLAFVLTTGFKLVYGIVVLLLMFL